MLDVWLIPVVIILAALVIGTYFAIKAKGGSGVRTDGRTIVDKPLPEEDLPPG